MMIANGIDKTTFYRLCSGGGCTSKALFFASLTCAVFDRLLQIAACNDLSFPLKL